jgi:hypothetical protein
MGKVLLHELGTSISFGALSLLGKVLWPMLLACSDDQGRGIAQPETIKWTVCQNVDELTIETIPDVLDEMQAQGMVHLYRDTRDRPVYQITRWWEYQQLQWAQPSKFDPPGGWTDRIRSQRGKQQVKVNWDCPGGFAPEEQPMESGNPPREPPGQPPSAPIQSNITQLNSIESNDNGAGAPPSTARAIATDAYPELITGPEPLEPQQWAALDRLLSSKATSAKHLAAALEWARNKPTTDVQAISTAAINWSDKGPPHGGGGSPGKTPADVAREQVLQEAKRGNVG